MEYPALILDQVRQRCRRLRVNFDAFTGDLAALADAIGSSTFVCKLEVSESTLGPDQYACIADTLDKSKSIRSLEFRNCKAQADGSEAIAKSILESNAPLRKFVFRAFLDPGEGAKSISAAALQRHGLQMVDIRHSHANASVHRTNETASLSTSLRKLTLLPDEFSSTRQVATNQLLLSLASNSSLTELRTTSSGAPLSAPEVAALEASIALNSTLRVLELRKVSGNDVLDAIGRGLRTNSALEELALFEMSMAKSDMGALGDALATNSTLRKLATNVNPWINGTVLNLQHGIRKGVRNGSLRLEELELWRTCPGEELVPVLGEALASPKGCSLRRLYFNSMLTTYDDIKHLLHYHSSKGSGLHELSLYGTNMGGDRIAASIVGHLLAPCCVMKNLQLQECSIGDEGIVPLGKALATNSTLKALDLSNNPIGEVGCNAIGTGLMSNSTLEVLVLISTRGTLAGDGGIAIGLALGENKCIALRDLRATMAGLQAEGVSAFASGLAGNTSLRHLGLGIPSSVDESAMIAFFKAAAVHPTLQGLFLRGIRSYAGSVGGVGELLSESASLRSLSMNGIWFVQPLLKALQPALTLCATCKSLDVGTIVDFDAATQQALTNAAVQSGAMTDLDYMLGRLGGAKHASEDPAVGAHRHTVIRKWMEQQLDQQSSLPGCAAGTSTKAPAAPAPRVLAGRAVAAMHLAAEGGAVDLTRVAAFVASCMDTIRGCMGRPVGEGGRDPGTMAMVSLVLGMGDACQAEYDEVERDRDGVPVVDELPGLRVALRHGGCFDRVRGVRRWAVEIQYPGLARLCGETLALEEADRRRQVLRWHRAVEAKRDAGRVFRAARDGRPLELGKRLRLGRLAGGLEMKGEMDGGAMVGPLDAARMGGHEECVRVLEEAMK